MNAASKMPHLPYRGRLAPSPTGLLHIGHACTFWMAYQRALKREGTLVLRIEDLDPRRSKTKFTEAIIEDLRWLGIRWHEGPDRGGPFSPYEQRRRREFYLDCWRMLRDRGPFRDLHQGPQHYIAECYALAVRNTEPPVDSSRLLITCSLTDSVSAS